jgi:BirA family biotin operon repressor/biotin-[acetyl-CoA-carboxylase] ligase
MTHLPLQGDALQEAARAAGAPWQVVVLPEVDSTSTRLRQLADRQPVHGVVLFAESQTAGRGRRDNTWTSVPGRDLIFSLGWRPDAPPSLWPAHTQAAALAVCLALETALKLAPAVKWPNDVLLNDRKVCGILTETANTADGPLLIIGIGLNMNGAEPPPGLADSATTLRIAASSPAALDRQSLALRLLTELHRQLSGFSNTGAPRPLLDELRRRNWLQDRLIRYTGPGGAGVGTVTGLGPGGELLVRDTDGVERMIHSAEQVRPLEAAPPVSAL